MKSKWQLQQEAGKAPPSPSTAANGTAPAVVKPEPQPSPASKPRGRPKTRLSTLDDLSEYLQVSRSTVYRLIDTEQLPHLRIGSVLRFDIPTVLKWAASFTERGDQSAWQDDQPGLKQAR